MSKAKGNKTLCLCGDYNIDLCKEANDKAASDLFELLLGKGFYPLIIKPSRITDKSETLIDHIFINSLESNIISGLIINDISDHLPVFFTFDLNMKRKEEVGFVSHRRLRNNEAINKFRQDLMEVDWKEVYVNEVNVAYGAFLNTYLALYDKHCPLVSFKYKKKNKNMKPWITKGLANACKKKNNLYRDYITQRTKNAEMKYKVYKNKLVVILRKAKKDYYNKLFQENKNNIKGIWNIFKEVLGNKNTPLDRPNYFIKNNQVVEDKTEVVNEFNSFFVNVGPTLANLIRKNDDPEYEEAWKGENRVVNSIFLADTTIKEIVAIVENCKNKKSTDCDGIDMVIIKKTLDCISIPLCYIFNLSLQSGVFPDRMKVAKVIPLYKSGDKHSFNNYRPVSLLSQFSKVLEKLFAQRLDSFIEKYQLINENQFGFRKNRSTALALLTFIDDISSATNNNKYTVGVFVDLKKAFDTLQHSILISKLYNYGVRGVALNWLRSYLENRSQYVHYLGNTSERLKIVCGVPQGSILGPKLFNLYINDICDVSKRLNSILFADDTNFYCSGENLKDLVEIMTSEMLRLKIWFDVNKLSLNLTKTKFMIFGNRVKEDEVIMSIDGELIERVTEFRFLGVIVDENLTWKSHIEYIRKKMVKNIYILGNVRDLLDYKTMRILYFSLFFSYFSYCIEVWGNTYENTIKPLNLLQKKVIRMIHNVKYREHTNKLFIKSKLLKLGDLVKLRTLLIMFKAKNNILPFKLQRVFLLCSGGEDSRRKFYFKHQLARTTQRLMSPTVRGIRLWNSLHYNLKNCINLYCFKKCYMLKTITQYEECE